MKNFWVALALLCFTGSGEAYAQSCAVGSLSNCPSPLYNTPQAVAFDIGTAPFAGAWAGTGFGFTSAPTVAQMAASLSATPQPLTVTTLTTSGAATIGGALSTTGAATIGGALTPSGGVVGVTNGSSAVAGSVGQILSAQTSTAVTLTSATAANLISLSVPAGIWQLSGVTAMICSTANMSSIDTWISPTSATASPFPTNSFLVDAGMSQYNSELPTQYVNLTTATTYYVGAIMVCSSGTLSGNGAIYALRIR
jgi:hypothetical protein